MAYFEINGISHGLQVFVDAADNNEQQQRKFSGRLFRDRRFLKSRYTCGTRFISRQERDALRGLIEGRGHVWDFEPTIPFPLGDKHSSKGLGELAGATSIVNGAGPLAAKPFNILVVTDVSYDTSSQGFGALWTLIYWRNEDVFPMFEWHHIVQTSDGHKWRDGVRSDGLDVTEATFVSGDLLLDNGSGSSGISNYDDVVALPFVVPDRWGDAWPRTIPYPSLPELLLSGDCLEEGAFPEGKTVQGFWTDSRPTNADGGVLYKPAFSLMES